MSALEIFSGFKRKKRHALTGALKGPSRRTYWIFSPSRASHYIPILAIRSATPKRLCSRSNPRSPSDFLSKNNMNMSDGVRQVFSPSFYISTVLACIFADVESPSRRRLLAPCDSRPTTRRVRVKQGRVSLIDSQIYSAL
ncbi:unnamed protein product [Trichogramma brassicae]|uniref:Uncharacterized protein n=1 Tax=Trichogramma brassicae TaxID=86971 RepID=A0A6H5J144_9HYME|nr:unnamed protein product [Trichogramma brassicae]